MEEQSTSSQLFHTKCVCHAARRASRALTQLYDLVLSPAGLKATLFITLQQIAEAGELAQWEFARGGAVATETLSRRLNLARKKGLLQVRRGAKRGERIYALTARGQECLRNALPHWNRAQARMAQALGTQDLQSIIACFDRITRAAREAEQIRTANSASMRSGDSRAA